MFVDTYAFRIAFHLTHIWYGAHLGLHFTLGADNWCSCGPSMQFTSISGISAVCMPFIQYTSCSSASSVVSCPIFICCPSCLCTAYESDSVAIGNGLVLCRLACGVVDGWFHGSYYLRLMWWSSFIFIVSSELHLRDRDDYALRVRVKNKKRLQSHKVVILLSLSFCVLRPIPYCFIPTQYRSGQCFFVSWSAFLYCSVIIEPLIYLQDDLKTIVILKEKNFQEK